EEAMGLAARDDEKRLVLSGLSDVKSPAALKLVEPYLDNEGLKAEASAAAVKICAQTSNLPNDEVVATLQKALPNVKDAKLRKAGEDALNKAQGQPVEETKKKKRGTEKAAEAQKAVAAPEKAAAKEKAPKAEAKGGKGGKAKAAGEAGAGLGKNAPVQPPVDFIKDWVLSGPYMQEGKTGNDLFDVAFPPEDPKAKDVKWAPMKSPKAPAHMFYIDLKYELGGDNRVAYMKTNVFSPKEQKAQLALGSDDSIIAWLNGEKVFGKKVSRSLKPGADKAPITLKEGENTLMLKVTQDKGYWGAVAQITAPDGSKLEGLKFQAAAEEGAASAPVSAARPKEQPAGSKPAEQGGAKAVEFIKDWVIAGPFKEEGKTGTDLLDVAFPPEEQGAGNVAWHQMKSPKAPAHLFYIDLKYEIGGENCVAYLRTTIESPKAQKALLKLGADDGAVVWVNGERVLAQKAIKSLKADAQSAPITLKEGANTLLIKVAQDSGYWGVVANIVAPDGSKLEGLKAVAPAVAAAPPAPQEETRKPK
ncbi:MAG: hypothetical protein NTW86_33030, partial [Candidatus Sumerlaeota bacterium]|nr:hypothetical protein [Candidatus Sumerlaeota bacterium]